MYLICTSVFKGARFTVDEKNGSGGIEVEGKRYREAVIIHVEGGRVHYYS